MKIKLLISLLLLPTALIAQAVNPGKQVDTQISSYLNPTYQLTLDAAVALVKQARVCASDLGKSVTISILDAAGQVILISRPESVGPHNTEASRRKAYTAVSTRTPTLALSRNTRSNPDAENLANLPELLLLGGGCPLWFDGKLIGAIGVAGGGSPENDDLIAKSASIQQAGILTKLN
ncbi:heme-binding protein [Dyadobacter sp. CY326]|uniref:GlcG/HbpS family heme-binding protein n=1 Tax=Dyadobacter sp. CY326 TaxID=2907300 RepID=UPI001F23987B|nr:heme-binding protein [Dyadobacter sp. CY326]MCE7065794.1 heme-binding protein [Dyadobacter sp. CY326]